MYPQFWYLGKQRLIELFPTAAGLGNYVETLMRKPNTEFNVGDPIPSSSSVFSVLADNILKCDSVVVIMIRLWWNMALLNFMCL